MERLIEHQAWAEVLEGDILPAADAAGHDGFHSGLIAVDADKLRTVSFYDAAA